MIVASLGGVPLRTFGLVATLGEPWHDFFLMAGTAAVTLVGLLFVALSLHVEVLFRKEHGDFRVLAAEAFQGYLYVLITALIFLVPVVDGHFAAAIFGFLNFIMLVRTAFRAPAFFRSHREKRETMTKRWRVVVPAIAYVLGIVTVLQWWGGSDRAAFGFFSPLVLMLAASTRTSWDLLEYVGRVRGAG
jgi:hypothetical protein